MYQVYNKNNFVFRKFNVILKRTKFKFVLVFICFSFLLISPLRAADTSSKIGYDFTLGGIIMPVEYYFSESNDYSELQMEPYYTISTGVTYELIDWFSIGVWFGYFHNSLYIDGAGKDGIFLLSAPITYGIKLIIGDFKVAPAFSINLGVTPSIGLYVNNIIINVFLGGITTTMIKMYDEEGVLISGKEVTNVLPYIEIGYHFKME